MARRPTDSMPGIGGVLRRQWPLAVFAAVVVLVTAVASLATQSPRYRAEAEVVIPLAALELPLRVDDPATSRATIDTEARWAASDEVVAVVRDDVGTGIDLAVTAPLGSETLVVSATSRSADVATAAADIYAETLVELRRERLVADASSALDTLSDLDAALGDVDVTDESPEAAQRLRYAELIVALESVVALADDVGPRVVRTAAGSDPVTSGSTDVPARLALAVVVAALLGMAVALVRDRLDPTVHGVGDVTRSGLTVLGALPAAAVVSPDGVSPPPTLHDADSPAAEAVRALRLAIAAHRRADPPRSLLVAGARHGSGASAVATHLAVAAARSGARCILVDADLRSPALRHLLDLDDEAGLTSVLTGDASLDSAVIRPASVPGLVVLTAGPGTTHPGDLLAGTRTRSLIASMVEQADLVIIDGPPYLDVADGLTLATQVDAAVVVASTASTTSDDLRDVIGLFDAQGIRPLGAVVVGVAGPFASASDTVLDLRGAPAEASAADGDEPGADRLTAVGSARPHGADDEG